MNLTIFYWFVGASGPRILGHPCVAGSTRHAAVEAINHWDMGPGIRSQIDNAMLNEDLSRKPAYAALQELIQHKFRAGTTHV